MFPSTGLEGWRGTGAHSTAGWLARTAGITSRAAREQVDAAQRVAGLPATRRRARRGDLSETKVRDIADAAAADPSAERDLLEGAGEASAHEVRERCRAVKAAAAPAEDEQARAERIKRERKARFFTSREGVRTLLAQGPATDLAWFEGLIDHGARRLFREAWARGEREPVEAYRYDALVDIARAAGYIDDPSDLDDLYERTDADADAGPLDERDLADDGDARTLPGLRGADGAGQTPQAGRGGGPGGGRRRSVGSRTLLVLRCSLAAWRRGTTEPGEVCDLTHVGPISVTEARAIAGDAFVSVVVTRGRDVLTVAHLGRTRDAAGSGPGAESKLILEVPVETFGSPPPAGAAAVHVPGVGPVAPDVAELLAVDPILAGLLAKGRDVTQPIARRHPNAFQRTALEWQHVRCAVQGCPNAGPLENDHTIEYEITHHTTLRELRCACWQCHHRLRNVGWTWGPVNPHTGTAPLRPPTGPDP